MMGVIKLTTTQEITDKIGIRQKISYQGTDVPGKE
jgi:hypothetical protein